MTEKHQCHFCGNGEGCNIIAQIHNLDGTISDIWLCPKCRAELIFGIPRLSMREQDEVLPIK